jgi:phosphoglycolate phosphatase
VPRIRLVVFDLDGTLVDSAEDLARATNRTLADVAPRTEALPLDVVKAFVGDGAGVLIERTLRHAGLDLPVPDVLPLFLAHYRECLLESTRLYPGVEAALDALADRALAVLTNKPGELSRVILDGLGIGERFRLVWGPDDAGARKPDPSGLLRLVDHLAFTPGETCLVGDSAVDVAAGRAAGVFTVGVTYGFNPAGLSTMPPDVFVDTIRALPTVLP